MGLRAFDTQEFSFEKTVYIRFPERKDFTLARYISLSLTGFSCIIPKAIPNVKTGHAALPVLPRIVRDVDALVHDPDSSVDDAGHIF